ncbi:MAG: Fic family protein [Methanoregula sp.]|jgi:death-on-curing protein|uniref:type II toxin-antitoxin system death-on-curing family toxin n=1 Tax=Methanoregula sp. TaxID=2052170 RepID=UPI003D13D1CB
MMLSADQVIDIHNDIIHDFGGEPGLRDPATLDYTIYQVNRSRTMYRKGAVALHGICTGHPFIDGNKRTALVTADNLVREHHCRISASNEAVVVFMLDVASYIHSRASVESWIKENTVVDD